MVYVMLSRVQCLSQLYILESIPVDKIKPFPEALEELKRMEKLDISKSEEFDPSHFKIVSLNTRSLNAHIEDIKCDKDILMSHVLCVQETCLTDQHPRGEFAIDGKQVELINRGSRGIATYYPQNFQPVARVSEETYQMTSLKSNDLIIINIYRSSDGNDMCLLENLKNLISSDDESIIICGDFNICQREEFNHPVLSFLKRNNFIAGFDPPQATHVRGRCIDQVYSKLQKKIKILKVCRSPSYFSDHCKVNITLQISKQD